MCSPPALVSLAPPVLGLLAAFTELTPIAPLRTGDAQHHGRQLLRPVALVMARL